MRQVVKIFSKNISYSDRPTLNDEILTVGNVFVAASQPGLISILGEIILSERLRDESLVRSDLDIVVCPGTLRRMTEELRSSSS